MSMSKERRRGASITAKMIASSSVLVLLVVGLFGIVSVVNTGRFFDVEEARLQKSAFSERVARGVAEARALARQSASALAEGDYEALQARLPEWPSDDAEIALAAVTDREGTVLAHSDRALNGQPLPSGPSRALALAAQAGQVELPGEHARLFAQPIIAAGAHKGTAFVALRTPATDEQIALLRADKESTLQAMWVRTGLIGLFFLFAAAAVAIFQGVRISRPVRMLAWRADQIARGDLETRVKISSGDELGVLGENFNFMSDRLVVAERETAARAAHRCEHYIAGELQRRGAGDALVDRGFVRVAGRLQPAEPSGGDFWAVQELSDGRVLVLVGDVTGHGIPAAVTGVVARAVAQTLQVSDAQGLKPSVLLWTVNQVLAAQTPRPVMAAFVALFDRSSRTIVYANAGLAFPYLRRGDGAPQVLVARANRLGDVADSRYIDQSQPFESGDQLCWSSDGLLERENEHGEDFGDKRLRAAIASGPRDAVALCDHITAEVQRYAGDRARADDVLFVVAQLA
jgi:HAMP domain-containing protein